MSARAWKCYRCNLIFRDESSAQLHKELSKHTINSAEIVEA
ncbi:hypothetical protein [Candidatus Nitrosotenuis cloacae]|nr:hypothetical protein [Candidatus Nitrosotenuis cloacae]